MNALRLPPGQQLAAPGKWPTVGEKDPAPLSAEWTVRASGLVENPRGWTLDQLRSLPQETRSIDIHCVTRWSMLDAEFGGVPLAKLLAEVRPTANARFISFVAHSPRGHSTSLPLEDARQLDVFLALSFRGAPITEDHGGPVRAITPGRYFYKSVKWLTGIELLTEDRLGYWEAMAGYHNRADPWQEERYVASGLSKQEAAKIFSSRDISGRELLSLDGADRNLAGLQARCAVLRNANFQRSDLSGANFSGANLTNAHFIDGKLCNATLTGADLEGVNFRGCDLRGADLRGASLFGATFVDSDQLGVAAGIAMLDASTQVDCKGIEALTVEQAEFVQRCVATDGKDRRDEKV